MVQQLRHAPTESDALMLRRKGKREETLLDLLEESSDIVRRVEYDRAIHIAQATHLDPQLRIEHTRHLLPRIRDRVLYG